MIQEKAVSETGTLGTPQNAPDMPAHPRVVTSALPKQMPWRLRLQISGESHTTVGMEVKEKILVGRTDPYVEIYPDLDLTPYVGESGLVSRRHLQIIQQDDALYVEDLDSKNGTRLNGFRLFPNQRYRLRDGDELALGELRIIIQFIKSPSPF